MTLKVYLSGEIHTDWREQITEGAAGLHSLHREQAGQSGPALVDGLLEIHGSAP